MKCFRFFLLIFVLCRVYTLHAQEGFSVAGEQIYHVPSGNEEVTSVAHILSSRLSEMTGSSVSVSDAAWKGEGILVALADQLPTLENGVSEMLKGKPAEAYAIDGNAKRVVIAGNSPQALKDAVYALLEQVGCRWLIPSARWTIIPKKPDLILPAQKTVSSPDYVYRSIWYAYGVGNMGKENAEALKHAYDIWVEANRLGGVSKYKIGHTYASTVIRHRDAFQAHPEYFAMDADGKRLPFKDHQSLCYSNPEVAQFFIQDKLEELKADKEKDPYAYVVSMDPNDGSVACFCPLCQKIGNGTDQALYLANQVARALRAHYPEAVVTLYAYASHRLPPDKVKAEPNIEVQVAMGFNKTRYSLRELVALWMEKVSSVGIRDYFGVMAWDWGLPGRGKASSYKYVSTNLPEYYRWGARAFNAETNANWASFGPASYLATKLLWNVKDDPEKIYNDFFTTGFGTAAEAVKGLYSELSRNSDLTLQNLHDWLSQLNKAFESADKKDPGVQARLTDLAAYLHYVVLYRRWELALGSKNQDQAYAALKPLLEFTWRIRDRNMVHAYALQRRLVNSGHPALQPLRDGWKFNDPEAVWRHPSLLSDAEVMDIFKQDLKDHPEDERIVSFGRDWAPADKALADEISADEVETKGALRYRTVWHAQVEKPEQLAFSLPMLGVKANYHLEIFDENGESVWESEARVDETSTRYEQKPFVMDVKFPKPGSYTLVFSAGEDYRPLFPADLRVVLDIGQENFPLLRMFGPGYFYVPKGTENILVVTDGRFSVIPPGEEKRVDYTSADNDSQKECIIIPVEGRDGQIWTMGASTSGKVALLNVPPYVATHPASLLIPKDALK